MEKFVNLTNSGKEKAIKAGTNVPSNAAGISLFNIVDISPANNISFMDLAETIPENVTGNYTLENNSMLAYADELGILHSLDGQYSFSSDDISISNVFMNKSTVTEKVVIDNTNPNDFVHHIYISRHFIPAPYVFSLQSLTQYVEPNRFKDLKIKVINSDGSEYVDKNSGRKKYRILLEPFRTEYNVNQLELPYRVIVLFDDSSPNGLKLVYDKIESDSNGVMFHLELQYKETINAVKFFDEQPEESFVLDDNYKNNRYFSLKKINKKYSEIIYNRNVDNGYQIVAPTKGIDDYRTFEVFNWRLIARVNNSINLNEIPDSNSSVDSAFNMSSINAGVLYSSLSDVNYELINSYIFNNLENSSFNITGTKFINKFATTTDVRSRDYWLVDIDSDNLVLGEYDILAWAPTSPPSLNQIQKIKTFLQNNGTLLLDLSSFSGDITTLDPQLRIADVVSAQFVSINESNILLDKNKNGGWDLTNSVYEKPEYSILGTNIVGSGYKSYKYFDNYAPNNSIIYAGPNTSPDTKSLGVVVPILSPDASSLVRGNIIATTFPILNLCNSLHRIENNEIITLSNTGELNAIPETMIYSGLVEGPFKFLYNCISYAAYCRVEASRTRNATSALYNLVSDWNSGWVMDKDALFEDEKTKYFKPIPGTSFYGMDVLDSGSVVSYYRQIFQDSFPEHLKDKLFGIAEGDIDFYIEITNKDVLLTNANWVDPASFATEENIPSSYTLYKVSDSSKKVFAYTEVPSPKLTVPDNVGPYVIIDKEYSSSNSKILNDNLALKELKQYPFSLKSRYSYSIGKDKPIYLDAKVDLDFKMVFKGTARRKTITYTTTPTTETLLVNVETNCQNIKSAVDDGWLRSTSSSQPNNIFLYSGDIDIHKDPRTWRLSSTSTGSTQTVTQTVTQPTVATQSEMVTVPAAGYTNNLSFLLETLKMSNTEFQAQLAKTNGVSAIKLFNVTNSSGTKSYGTVFYAIKPSKITVDSVLGPVAGYKYTVQIYTAYSTYAVPSTYQNSSNPLSVVQLPTNQVASPTSQSQTTSTTIVYSSSNTSPGSSFDYVKYIQYTINVARNTNLLVDGVFGAKTESAVIAFQKANNQRYLDGTVDSETKYYLAMVWKNLKTYYPELYTNSKKAAPTVVIPYIEKIDTIGLASEINSKTYKKLTFSGFTGPNEGKDIIAFEIPSDIKTISSIKIETDSDLAWQNFTIDAYSYGSVNDLFKGTYVSANKTPSQGKIELNLGGVDASNAKYFWLSIVGKSIPGFGSAEGFSIKSIKVFGKKEITQTNPGDPVEDIDEYTEDIWASVSVSAKDLYNGISTAADYIKTYTTNSYPITNSLTSGSPAPFSSTVDEGLVSSISITSLDIGDAYDENGFITASPMPDGNPISIDLDQALVPDSWSKSINISTLDTMVAEFNFGSSPEFIKLIDSTISEITSNGIIINDNSLIDISSSGNTITAETSTTAFGSTGGVIREEISLAVNYNLRTVDGLVVTHPKNTISVNDGIMLLCDNDGLPIGIPSISSSTIEAGLSNVDEEIDLRYGTFSVSNVIGSQDGFICGFFDVQSREFLGTRISYVKLVEYGLDNIFIGICAIDADGNTQSKNDYIGIKTSNVFKPVKIPLKIIAPIYSVKLNNRPAIRVSPIDPNTSKLDAWELPVSSGSFWKTIQISKKRNWTGWKSSYIGQNLKAFYSTFNELNNSWSDIFGYGNYDISNESPKLIDDMTIQLRKTPLLNIKFATDKLDSVVGIIKQNLSIFIRDSVDSDWNEIPYKSIRDIDSSTGVIKFRSRIIPNKENLIKVNYTVSNKNNLLRQVNGIPIPINPVLNSDTIDFDEPLYIYLLPKAIYKSKSQSQSFEEVGLTNGSPAGQAELALVSEYIYTNSINFTYDKSIFDSRSSKYDPFALPLAIIYVSNNPYRQPPSLTDIRVRGGGVVIDKSNYELEEMIPDVLSYWDVYPALGHAYARGGYVIIRIPIEVKNHFLDEKEIYEIISNNLTAGVAYELQDIDGKSWN